MIDACKRDHRCPSCQLNFFSLCGKLMERLPVCGWLRVAVAFIKRRANKVTKGYDDQFDSNQLKQMVKKTVNRVCQEDAARATGV